MATAPEVAMIVEGAGDVEEAARRLTETGLGVADSGNHVLTVGGTVAVAHVGGNSTNNAYWIVYDVHNPSKSKIKVRGSNETPTDQRETN
jgi:hypothetical protein